MADSLTKARRSWNMSRIKGKDTEPEKIVRSLLHRMGFRFRCQQRIFTSLNENQVKKRLEGIKKTSFVKPDIILRKYKAVVFIHGCFWHCHKGCKDATMPKSRTEWWRNKLEGNAARDRRNQIALRRAGWRVLTVWECETTNQEKLIRRMKKFFSASFSGTD